MFPNWTQKASASHIRQNDPYCGYQVNVHHSYFTVIHFAAKLFNLILY